MQRDRTRRSVKHLEHTLEESYESFCNRPAQRDSPLEASSFLHDEWAPLTTEELKKCLPEEYSETFDGKLEAMLSASSTPPVQESTFRTLLDRLKSNSTADRSEALKELIRLTSQGCLTIEQSVVIDFSALFRESDAECFDAALACYQSQMKQCIVKPQFIPIAIERAYRTPDSKNIGSFLAYLFTHHAKLYQQLAVEALVGPSTQLQQAFMWSLAQLVGIFGVRNLNYLTTYMANLKNILSRPESTRLKEMTVKLLQQCMKAEGPDCIMSQLKDLPEEAVQVLQNQPNTSFSYSTKEKSVSVVRQSLLDPLKRYNEEWVNSLAKVSKQSDKVKLLEQLLETLKDIKSLPGDYKHLSNMLKQLLNSNNMSVYLIAIRIIGEMARCQGRNYQQVALDLLPALLTKYRDKKPQVSAAVDTCLNQFTKFLEAEQLLPLIRDGLEDKNGSMKVHTMHLLEGVTAAMLESCPKPQLTLKYSLLQEFLPDIFETLLKNSSSQVRYAAVDCLRKMSEYLPSDQFPIVLEAQRVRSPDTHASRRSAPTSKSHSTQKDKKGDNNLVVVKLLSRINDDGLSIEKKKDVIQQLDRYFQDGDASTLSRLSCLQLVSTCLRKFLMESPKLLFRALVLCVGNVYSKVGNQLRSYSKPLVRTLLESLKSQACRKELLDSLQTVCRSVGLDQFMPTITSALESDRSQRAGILQFGVANWELFGTNECAMLSKGLVSCLNDKWQEVRQLAVEFANKLAPRLDMNKLRHIANRTHSRVPKELEAVFAQLEHRAVSERLIAPANSPVHITKELFPTLDTEQTPKGEPKDIAMSSSLELSPNLIDDSSRKTFALSHSLFRDDLQFDPSLADEEWLGHVITFEQERHLKIQLSRLFKPSVYDRMFALEHSSSLELVDELRSLCCTVQHNPYFSRLYVLLLKWVLLRLWGGCRPASSLISLAEQIIGILEEEKTGEFKHYISLVMAIAREYILGTQLLEKETNYQLNHLINSGIELFSGKDLLVAMVGEYEKDLRKIHSWVTEHNIKYQRQSWLKLMKSSLLQFMDDRLVLAHISQVQQLRKDSDICEFLFQRCSEEEITAYGFVRPVVSNTRLPPIMQEQSEPKVKQNEESQLIGNEDEVLSCESSLDKKGRHVRQCTIQSVPLNQQKSSVEVPSQKEFATLVSMTFNPQGFAFPRSKEGSHYRRVTDQLQMSLNTFHSGCNSSLIEQLDRLTEGDLHNITYFEELLRKPTLKVSAQLRQNAEYLLASFVRLCLCVLEIRKDVPPVTVLRCYGLLLEVAKCQYVMHNAKKAIPHFIEFALHQTVHEQEQRSCLQLLLREKCSQLSEDSFVRLVNQIMMRILENCPSQLLFQGLVTISIKTLKSGGSMRLKETIRRCLNRAVGRYNTESTENDFTSFAATANLFYSELDRLVTPDDPFLELLVGVLRHFEARFGSQLASAQIRLGRHQDNRFIREYGSYFESGLLTSSNQSMLNCLSCNSFQRVATNPIILSSEAVQQLASFQQEYPDFHAKAHLMDQHVEPEVEQISSSSPSSLRADRNIFEQIRQQICGVSCSEVSDDLSPLLKASKLRENVRIARARLANLQSRIRRH